MTELEEAASRYREALARHDEAFTTRRQARDALNRVERTFDQAWSALGDAKFALFAAAVAAAPEGEPASDLAQAAVEYAETWVVLEDAKAASATAIASARDVDRQRVAQLLVEGAAREPLLAAAVALTGGPS